MKLKIITDKNIKKFEEEVKDFMNSKWNDYSLENLVRLGIIHYVTNIWEGNMYYTAFIHYED